jgi:hypothetical protein
MSVAFIRGKLEVGDIDLLGESYEANLRMQAAATAQQLLDGCWKAWEGQFFDCFSERRGYDTLTGKRLDGPDVRMVVDQMEFNIPYWYPHGVSGDYGFSGSKAAAHLFVRLAADETYKDGRLLILDEYLEPGKTAKDYATDLIQKWFLQEDPYALGGWKVPELPRTIQMWAVSPDANRKDGSVNEFDVPFSRLDTMNGVLGQWGFSFMLANDDRKSGWMKVYQMLRDGELVISRNCKQTIEMFQTRLKDPKKFDDILKVAGDPLDDCADSLRYGVMTWNMVAIKPKAERIAEAVQGLDPTNAYMTVRKIELEDRRDHGGGGSFSPKLRRGGGMGRPW